MAQSSSSLLAKLPPSLVILQLKEKIVSSSECEDMVHRLQVAVGEAGGLLTYSHLEW